MGGSPFTQIHEQRAALQDLCRRFSVRRLRLFGSAANGPFDPIHSDLDMVVDFFDQGRPGIADRFLNLAEGLEQMFHRDVDLLTENSIKNPIFRREVDSTGQIIYEAGSP